MRGRHRVVPPRVLVLRALGLGDLLAGVPALRALRRAFPQHAIVLAAPDELTEPARFCGDIDGLLPASAPGRAVPDRLDWEGPPPEVAVNLHGNGPAGHRLLTALRPARVMAFAHPDTPEIAGPVWRDEEHERDRWCRLLRAYGLSADPRDLRMPRPPGDSPAPGAVVVHPGAGAPSRCWPMERFAVVVAALRRAGHRVAVTAGPGEETLAASLAARAGLPPDDVHSGLTYGRLATLVADARAVLSGDTGIAHLAVAQGTPSVTLFGPVPPRLWGPPPFPRHRALWHPGTGGDPDGRRPDPQLLRIGTDEVLDALTRLDGLARGTEPRPPGQPRRSHS